jgi:hypothetical protein
VLTLVGVSRVFGIYSNAMAKFEEADPRWKVKELGDAGKNVNNWYVVAYVCEGLG